jgi:3-oxo-5-alpha-steroid 4-dehydrogenase 1
MDKHIFKLIVDSWIILALIVFLLLLFITAPYGRHTTRKWGFTIPNRLGWFFMETPVLIVFLYFFITGKAEKNVTSWMIVMLFALHYVNRSLIYPFRIKTKGKEMPLLIVFMALFFNTMNGFINGYYIGTYPTHYTVSWLYDIRFIAGVLIFFTGMIINMKADEKLIHLRKSSTNGYQIPYGALFNTVSCPNFLGEIIEWTGFTILCWSLPALSFLIWTISNLVPRALNHHQWYKNKFPDYPANRKAILPYLL